MAVSIKSAAMDNAAAQAMIHLNDGQCLYFWRIYITNWTRKINFDTTLICRLSNTKWGFSQMSFTNG